MRMHILLSTDPFFTQGTVKPRLTATSLQRPLFFILLDKTESLHWPLFKTSSQRPLSCLSSVPKVGVVERSNCSPTSSKNSHFQNETKCKTFLKKMRFICMRIKNHFHFNGFTLMTTGSKTLSEKRWTDIYGASQGSTYAFTNYKPFFWVNWWSLIVVGKGQQESPKSQRTQGIVYVGLCLPVYSNTKIIWNHFRAPQCAKRNAIRMRQ